jgi:hypothetical protein
MSFFLWWAYQGAFKIVNKYTVYTYYLEVGDTSQTGFKVLISSFSSFVAELGNPLQ